MATRYLTALDYSDLHANAVLRKHAKKRPLGQLESRYQYTPPQPVLSCRTVDIDVSGTRTYRPRSTTDILQEQQQLIHRLFTASRRTATSAPPRRSSPRKGLGQVTNGTTTTTPYNSNNNNANTNNNSCPTPTNLPHPSATSAPLITGKGKSAVHVQGRPCTSMSQNSEPVSFRQKSTSSGQRPKTTGRLKNVKPATDSFLAQDLADEDLLETRRSHSELTSQIHAYWRPDGCPLNQGHFMRGQKRPDDVPPTLDAWLTFGGAPAGGEESGGVLDAFASFQSPKDYYNIEGSVGSRVAEQLQKGDRIRIGVNGEVLSHDLKVKKGVKGERGQQQQQEEEEEEVVEGEGRKGEAGEEEDTADGSAGPTPREKAGSARDGEEDPFGDTMTFDSLHNVMADGDHGDPRRPKTVPLDLPLSWEDQVSRPEVKVIHARLTPRDPARENLCETHPVIFNRVVRSTRQRPRLASSTTPSSSYTLKQRTLPPSSSSSSPRHRDPRHPSERGAGGAKVKAISFNPHSPEDEQRLSSLSVDDVIQKRLEKTASSSASASASSPGPKPKSGSRKEERSGDPAEGSPPKAGEQKVQEKNLRRSASALSKSSRSSGESLQGKTAGNPTTSGKPLVVPRPSSSMPTRGAREVDLGVVTPAASLSRKPDQSGEKPTRHLTALPLYRGLGSSVSSINSGPIPGDTEFIQISQPIRNPRVPTSPSPGPRPLHSPPGDSAASTPLPPPLSPARSHTPDNNGLAGGSGAGTPRTVTPTPQRSLAASPTNPGEVPGEDPRGVTPDLDLSETAPGDVSRTAMTPVSTASTPPPVKAISIPTGDRLEDEEEEEELTTAQRRERTLRDQHIEQITDLLEGAILSGGHQ